MAAAAKQYDAALASGSIAVGRAPGSGPGSTTQVGRSGWSTVRAERGHHRDGHVDVGPGHELGGDPAPRGRSRMAGPASSRPDRNWLDVSPGSSHLAAGERAAVDLDRAGGPGPPTSSAAPPRARMALDDVAHRARPQRRGRRRRGWCPSPSAASAGGSGRRARTGGRRRGRAAPAGGRRSPARRPARRAQCAEHLDAEGPEAVDHGQRCRRPRARRASSLVALGQRGAHQRPVGDALRAGHRDDGVDRAGPAASTGSGSGSGAISYPSGMTDGR